MAFYRHPNCRSFAEITLSERLSNQIVFSGTSDTLLLPNGVFLLDFLLIEAGKTVTIKDGKGVTIATGITAFNQEHTPLRCDYGFEIIGDVQLGKGSVHNGIFVE